MDPITTLTFEGGCEIWANMMHTVQLPALQGQINLHTTVASTSLHPSSMRTPGIPTSPDQYFLHALCYCPCGFWMEGAWRWCKFLHLCACMHFSKDKVGDFDSFSKTPVATTMSQKKKGNHVLEKLRKQEYIFVLEKTVPCVGKSSALQVKWFKF